METWLISRVLVPAPELGESGATFDQGVSDVGGQVFDVAAGVSEDDDAADGRSMTR
ncbi:hypothetical protein PV341_26145 [Streptomyces sp. PA03-1a]|nr:hypothetical protein [Streptomyces sp. PA03-1a]